MGKVKVVLYFYLTADILTKVLQKCSLRSPHQQYEFCPADLTADFDLLPWQPKG